MRLSYKEASYYFNYDPETGILSNKFQRGSRTLAGRPAGSVNSWGYLDIKINGHSYKAHKIAWVIFHGKDTDLEIDHIDGNGANNKICNLRECTRSENEMNKGICKNNTSGVKGVHFNTKTQKWRAVVGLNNRNYSGGCFSRKEDAEIAVKALREKLHNDFSNHGEFIKQPEEKGND